MAGASRNPLAVITGAYGGTGRAVARRLGVRYRLVLAGRDTANIVRLRDSLEEEGYDVVAAVTADVTSERSVTELAAAAAEVGRLGALVHTAGLSPVQAPWQAVVAVNLAGSALLLDAFRPVAEPGSVAVCIGSSAAYTIPVPAAVDALLDEPRADDLIPKLEALLAEAVTAVEELVAFKAAGVNASAKLQEPSANRVDVGDPIFLFSFDASARNVLLELTGQIFLEFAHSHDDARAPVSIEQKLVKPMRLFETHS